jgi:hypothetical protein
MKRVFKKIYLALFKREDPYKAKKPFAPVAEPIEMDIGPEISPNEAMPWERN